MKKNYKYYQKQFLKLESEHREKVTLLRKEAEEQLLKEIDLLGKPVKIIGRKGWNTGIVTDIRLDFMFNKVVTVNKVTFLYTKIVELKGDELAKYELNERINKRK